MKVIGYIAAVVGFLLVIGAVGSSDFYEECRAAADCVAGSAPSMLQICAQVLGGLVLGGFGLLLAGAD